MLHACCTPHAACRMRVACACHVRTWVSAWVLGRHKQKLLEGKIAHIVDHKIGATLEFLSKELVRYKCALT